MSYAGASSTGPCEGRQASPSNPTARGKARAKELMSETFVFRCTVAEKADLRVKAQVAGLSAADLLREALGATQSRRRKSLPHVNPALVLAVSGYGGNLNQVARWLNRATRSGHVAQIEALRVAAALVAIERQLGALIEHHRDVP